MKTLTGKFTDRFGRGTEAHVFFTFRVENEYDLTVRVPRTPAEYRGEPARDLELMASHYVNDPVRIDVAQTLLGPSCTALRGSTTCARTSAGTAIPRRRFPCRAPTRSNARGNARAANSFAAK
jgi:hypothetical protein